MNEWIPKNKIVKIAASIAFFTTTLYLVIIFVVFKETNKLENFYQSAESNSAKEEKFQFIKTTIETNKESIQILEDFFVKKDDEVKFIEQIESVARDSTIKFEIISIEVKNNQTDPFKENVSVKINVEGPWKNIMFFINKIEKMNFGVLIEGINLDTKTLDNWTGFIEFVIFREK